MLGVFFSAAALKKLLEVVFLFFALRLQKKICARSENLFARHNITTTLIIA